MDSTIYFYSTQIHNATFMVWKGNTISRGLLCRKCNIRPDGTKRLQCKITRIHDTVTITSMSITLLVFVNNIPLPFSHSKILMENDIVILSPRYCSRDEEDIELTFKHKKENYDIKSIRV